MKLGFWKMTGAGNDFVLLAGPVRDRAGWARRLCDRREGVGADGLLVLQLRAGRIRMTYNNADGSAAFCGNGARCAAWWAFRQGWAGRDFVLATEPGELRARIRGREQVELGMPEPGPLRRACRVRAGGRVFSVHYVDTGAPHAVVEVRGLDAFPVAEFGAQIRRARVFGPAGANVDFVSRCGRGLKLRTFERGVEAETLACGTGAVAAALTAWQLGWTRPPVRIRVRSGDTLTVSFRTGPGAAREVRLSGPARIAFQGEVAL
ncbi:MAG: diaminopimelate epimerase [Elusimicrobiota bacterium]|jgi:diaminopimelate epimerase